MTIIRPAPIADQVNALLRERIRNGTYLPGSRLPSESELCGDFGVSRATIRTVLAKLSAEGLILRKQGDGTYVNEHIHQSTTYFGGLWEFSRLIESSGFPATIKTLSIVKRTPSVDEIDYLNLSEGEHVLALQRLFYAGKRPVILANNCIPVSLLDFNEEPFNGNIQIREFLWRYCHRRIAYAVSDLNAIMGRDEVVKQLEFSSPKPILRIQIVFYDRDNQPLACGHSYFDDTRLRLRLVQTWSG